jgi:predicted amidohydrolase
MARVLRVAAWQYPIERIPSWDAWVAKLSDGIAEASSHGASVCVVPEYASMELTALLPEAAQATLADQLDGLQPLLPGYLEAYAAVARRHGVVVVGGSFPERVASGQVHNRARVHGPAGGAVVVEKLQMTRFEEERWGVAAGAGQAVIDLGGLGDRFAGTRLGVALCYDAEFPLLVRRLAVAGADVIAVPSCTDAATGYHRVRVACQARALENQCYVVQAPTVGSAPWSIAVDENVGAAGVFAPPDRDMPDDGVVAIGPLCEPGWVVADLDLDAIAAVRRDGQVLGHRDWDRPQHADGAVVSAALTAPR